MVEGKGKGGGEERTRRMRGKRCESRLQLRNDRWEQAG